MKHEAHEAREHSAHEVLEAQGHVRQKTREAKDT